jgi:hypothetical protein
MRPFSHLGRNALRSISRPIRVRGWQCVRILTCLSLGLNCRLYKLHSQITARQDEARAAAERPVDAETGRPLFCPATGRAPVFRRNQDKLAIGEYLYNIRCAHPPVASVFLPLSLSLSLSLSLCVCVCVSLCSNR